MKISPANSSPLVAVSVPDTASSRIQNFRQKFSFFVTKSTFRTGSKHGKSPQRRKNRAETLMEAIIAVTILLFLLGPATSLFISSNRSVGRNRLDLVAANLAEEGIEMVRNMRDSNLIKFSAKAKTCWNTAVNILPTPTLNDCDQPASKIGDETANYPQNFFLYFNPTNLQWSLRSTSLDLETAIDKEKFRLRLDIPTVQLPTCVPQMQQVNVPGCRHVYFLPSNALLAQRGVESQFYRQVTVEYLDLDGNGNIDQRMRVTSLVMYSTAQGMRKIKRITRLTNQPL